MPAAIAIPAIATAIGGGAAATASIYGAHKQGQANDRALAVQERGDNEQLNYLRQKDAEDKARWDADEARRQPYRQAAAGVLAHISGQPYQAPQARPMPQSQMSPMTLSSLVRTGQAPPPPPQAQQRYPGTLADIYAQGRR